MLFEEFRGGVRNTSSLALCQVDSACLSIKHKSQELLGRCPLGIPGIQFLLGNGILATGMARPVWCGEESMDGVKGGASCAF